jgi:UDP-GlcNAc:undecaprenyl-phosphate GlcNAc-1-phosphate transferase
MIGFLLVHLALLLMVAGIAGGIAWLMAQSRLLVDVPGPRSSHERPTPRGGGLGIVVACALGWSAFWAVGFTARSFADGPRALLIGALVVAAGGLLDDWRRQRVAAKLAIQALAATIAIAGGLTIERVALPGLGVVTLPGWVGAPLAFLWLVGLTNAFNFMDGLDALAASTATIAGLALALAGIAVGAPSIAATGWVLAAAAAGFLALNRPPARIFMGDVGSQFLGFALAAIGLYFARLDPGGAAIWFVPVLMFHFLFDTILTAARRWRAGENVLAAHRGHLYQRLHAAGLDHGTVAVWLSIAAAFNAAVALWTIIAARNAPWLALIPALVLQGYYLWLVRRRERQAAEWAAQFRAR